MATNKIKIRNVYDDSNYDVDADIVSLVKYGKPYSALKFSEKESLENLPVVWENNPGVIDENVLSDGINGYNKNGYKYDRTIYEDYINYLEGLKENFRNVPIVDDDLNDTFTFTKGNTDIASFIDLKTVTKDYLKSVLESANRIQTDPYKLLAAILIEQPDSDLRTSNDYANTHNLFEVIMPPTAWLRFDDIDFNLKQLGLYGSPSITTDKVIERINRLRDRVTNIYNTAYKPKSSIDAHAEFIRIKGYEGVNPNQQNLKNVRSSYVAQMDSAADSLKKEYPDLFKFKEGGQIMPYMQTRQIEINDKAYDVIVASTEGEREEGLSNVAEMLDSEGCLFIFPEPIPAEEVIFTCEDMSFDLDILFLDSEGNVLDKQFGKAESQDQITPSNLAPDVPISYVLELNANSDVSVGDEVDLDPDSEEVSEEEVDKMYVLGSDGKPQATIVGGERIFSRKNTKVLIRQAKRADKSKKDSDYKRLGKSLFKFLDIQDNQEAEYVTIKE